MPRRAMVSLVLAAGLGLLGGGLTACGSSTGAGAGEAAGGPSSLTVGPSATSAPPTSAPPTSAPPTIETPGAPTTTRGPATTVTGTVNRAAIEGSCLVLSTEVGDGAMRRYLLLGDSVALRGLVEGATVTVTGRPEAGLATACQNGTPFLVEQVLPASGTST